jgi:deoxyribonuclease-4
MIWFGPAGNSDSFYEQGYKHSWQMPKWLNDMGLNAYEYQCNKGVNLKDDTAREIGERCKESNIRLSIHAPYYIKPFEYRKG